MPGKRSKPSSGKQNRQEIRKDERATRLEEAPKTPLQQHSKGGNNPSTKPAGWEFWDGDAWTPTPGTALKLLMSARLCAALWSGISDCDETFNYWEPAHFIYRGRGFQTWEYSPVYAIRSYGYILLHILPIKLLDLFISDNSILMFFMVRCILGLACALSEMVFYRGVCVALGPSAGRLTLAMLIFSSGMFISSTSFIPSSFSMYLTMTALGAWFMGHVNLAILSVAASAIVGWPFAGVLGIGIAIDAVFVRRDPAYFLKWSLIGLAAFLIPLVLVDDFYYGKFVVAPLNIVLYNIFSGHGPELYGVEPASFYFINGFLNLNVAFLLALVSLPVMLISSYILKHKMQKVILMTLTLLPMYVWILIFFTRPHKEERFLFPIYPLFILAASMVVDHSQRLLQLMVKKTLGKNVSAPSWPGAMVCLLFALVSASRIMALNTGYHAPMDIYVELHKLGREDLGFESLSADQHVNVCVGKEWYRYTSTFFMPRHNWHLRFLQSEFKGQLPKPYDTSDPFPTRLVPSHMNDLNREEPSRYTPVNRCHFLIDRDDPSGGTRLEPQYSQQPQWTVVKSVPFLDSSRSHRLYRAFYIPALSLQHCVYTNYTLLKNTAKLDKLLRRAGKS